MHGLKQLVYDNQPFFSSNQTGKTNRELYILWKQNKRDDIFLLLYTQLWMVLEEVYMENVIDYYKKVNSFLIYFLGNMFVKVAVSKNKKIRMCRSK